MCDALLKCVALFVELNGSVLRLFIIDRIAGKLAQRSELEKCRTNRAAVCSRVSAHRVPMHTVCPKGTASPRRKPSERTMAMPQWRRLIRY